MKRAAIPLALSFLGCLVAAAMIWPERRYVSTAILGEAPNPTSIDAESSIADSPTRLAARIREVSQSILSRAALTAMIRKLDLYPEESRTVPIEDLIDNCRKTEIRISRTNGIARLFEVSFRHQDPRLAQAAAQYLTSRILETNLRLSEAAANTSIAFLERHTEAAAKDLAAKQEDFRNNAPAGADERRRAAFDVELARAHYLRLRGKVASAAMKSDWEPRALGPRLELLDSASLPVSPEFPWWPALGWGAGTGFAIGTLVLSIPFLRRVTLRQAAVAFACGAACLGVAAIVVFASESYTSRAIVTIVSGNVPQSLLPWDPHASQELLASIRGNCLSTSRLTNVISNNGLYPSLLRRAPLVDVINRMRENIEINETGPTDSAGQAALSSVLHISFRHENRYLAQKVAQDIVGHYSAEFQRLRIGPAEITADLLQRDCESAAKEWTRAVHATGPNPDRLALDIDLARKRYIALKEKAANASVAAALIARPSQGPHLEMLDPASLPEETEFLDNAILSASALFGIIAGLIWKRPRQSAP